MLPSTFTTFFGIGIGIYCGWPTKESTDEAIFSTEDSAACALEKSKHKRWTFSAVDCGVELVNGLDLCCQ